MNILWDRFVSHKAEHESLAKELKHIISTINSVFIYYHGCDFDEWEFDGDNILVMWNGKGYNDDGASDIVAKRLIGLSTAELKKFAVEEKERIEMATEERKRVADKALEDREREILARLKVKYES